MQRQLIKSIIILLFCTLSASAETALNSAKYIQIYKKHFDQAIAADLYASLAENQTAQALRSNIFDYLNSKDYQISQEELEQRWQTYLKSYASEEVFANKLKNSYLSKEIVKKKFIQNQYLNDYFSNEVSNKVSKDIENRSKIIALAKQENIEISEAAIKEKLQQLIENWGGQAHYDGFLLANNISEDEINFFIKSDLAKEAWIQKMLSKDLTLDSAFLASINSAIYNHFNNFNLTQTPDYYFTQVFIAKDIDDAQNRINKAHQEFSLKKRITTSSDPAIEITQMSAPVNASSDLYLPVIKDTVLKLSNNELFVNQALSPVISTEHGYHFFQLRSIEVPNNLTYDSAKPLIYEKIKKQQSRDFDKLFFESLK